MNAPRRFRKKPVEIRAIRFAGWKNAEEVQRFAPLAVFVPAGYEHRLRYEHEHDRCNGNVYEENAPAFLVLMTAGGDVRVDIGDWVVCGEHGEIFASAAEVFEQSYEQVVGL